MRYPLVDKRMSEAYPELEYLESLYEEKFEVSQDIADGMIRYCAVLCAPSNQRDIEVRLRAAEKGISTKIRKQIEILKEDILETDKRIRGMVSYNLMITMWFRMVANVDLEVWFAYKMAISEQMDYIRRPVISEDPAAEAEGKRKVGASMEMMRKTVKDIESELFTTDEVKSIVNDTLQKHAFAGYPEYFALDRPH